MHQPNRRLFKFAFQAVLFLFVGATLILWSWNATLPSIFGLPVIEFKESLALIILIVTISFVSRLGRHTLCHYGDRQNEH